MLPMVLAPISLYKNERAFEKHYNIATRNDEVISHQEWADAMAGAYGLTALDQFAHDKNINRGGHYEAEEARIFILNGGHQQQLIFYLRYDWYKWPRNCAILYLYLIDGVSSGHWPVTSGMF
jgi:hypothetical protein